MTIVENHYGKSRVRVARVVRQKDRHELHEMTVAIQLEGDFDTSYAAGDNRLIVATDSMKNTVYVLAKDPAVAQPESFGLLIGRHFLNTYAHVTRARVEVLEHSWERHGRFSFIAGGQECRLARINVTRDQTVVEAGVTGYVLLKTTGSAFEGYIHDRYTTLKEASDRILASSIDAVWRYASDDVSWGSSWHAVMKLITDTFAEHDSKSVQHTVYAIGEAVLGQCANIDQIRLTMPNKHYLPVNLEPFGLDNSNDIFCPTDEPHGLIEAVLSR
jgi:urate oxidase